MEICKRIYMEMWVYVYLHGNLSVCVSTWKYGSVSTGRCECMCIYMEIWVYVHGNRSVDVCWAKLRFLHKCIYTEICQCIYMEMWVYVYREMAQGKQGNGSVFLSTQYEYMCIYMEMWIEIWMYLHGNRSVDVCLAKLRVLHKCIYMEIC